MSTNTRRVLLFGSVSLAVLAIAWVGFRGDQRVAVDEERPASLQWRAGSSQRYNCLVDSDVQVTLRGTQRPQAMRQKLEGLLDFRTLETGPKGPVVGLRLSGAEYRVSGVSDAGTNRVLATPFRVRFDQSGMPLEFEFAGSVGLAERALLEELVRTFQVSIRGERSWISEERHATGTYSAEYVQGTDAPIEKTKLHYQEPPRAAAGAPSTRVTSSKGSITIDAAKDWVAAVRVDETLETQTGSGMTAEVTTHAELVLVPSTPRSTGAVAELWAFTATELPVAAKANGRKSNPAVELTREELEKQLRASLEALDSATEGRIAWIHRMRDILQANEELAFVLLEMMEEGELEDRTRADLYLVFELAGTPDAQEALCRVVREPTWTRKDGLRALIALGGVANPTEDSLQTLWDTSRSRSSSSAADLANTASLALGSIGNHMLAEGAEGYADLRDELTDAVWSAESSEEQAVALIALGNTGDASLAPDVATLLDASDSAVRAAAATTLGRLGTEDATADLMRRLDMEPSSRVRASIAGALSSWKSPSSAAMESIRTMVRTERDDMTRLRMARILGQNLNDFPENAVVLNELLATAKSKQIRAYAAKALAEARALDRGRNAREL
jgi:hypothetical protein